jgi:uncharacterized membrane protein
MQEARMILTLGLILFAGPHFYSSLLLAHRNALRKRLGEGAFKGIYSLISLLGLILVGYAYWISRESGEMLYTPSGTMRHATAGLATLAMLLIFSNQRQGYISAWVKQPFSIGIALWCVAHLLSVGKWAVAWMWIVLLAIALVDIVLSMLRGKTKSFQPKIQHDLLALLVAAVVTAIFVLWFHPYVLGVSDG